MKPSDEFTAKDLERISWDFARIMVALKARHEAQAGGATVSERERVPSAVDVTVEEWEALEACVALQNGYQPNPRLAREAMRKLNARAALSKSETTAAPQPESSGGGEGEDYAASDEAIARRAVLINELAKGPRLNAIDSEIRTAREIGAKAERESFRVREQMLLGCRDADEKHIEELQEKLAAAETSLRRILEDDEPGLSLETLIERVELDVNCEWERAEKAEAERDGLRAKVEAWEPVVVAAIEQTESNFFFEGSRIRHCSEKFWPAVKAIPAEHRPEAKP